ncbi:MAG: helix-turn-helix transcriptional regulator [Gemmatimonadota bacterium]|nr:helix-turn-helix transcriptional regulator [Gemmatimonadota bacterium]
MTPAEIGRIVRAARRAQGLRQDQLAGAAGVGIRFLSELERGKTTVRLEKVIAVLDALGCTLRVEMPPTEPEACDGIDAPRDDSAAGKPDVNWSYE